MIKLVRFNTAKTFQSFLKTLIDETRELKTLRPKEFDGISVTVRRLVAAALIASYDADPQRLAALIDYKMLPQSGHKDKRPEANPYQKTVHVTALMYDYIKAGSARLNIEVLGPLEDSMLEHNPDAMQRYRLTDRQYLHLSLLYLATLEDDQKILMMNASEVLHPFLYKGMTREQPKTKARKPTAKELRLQHSH